MHKIIQWYYMARWDDRVIVFRFWHLASKIFIHSVFDPTGRRSSVPFPTGDQCSFWISRGNPHFSGTFACGQKEIRNFSSLSALRPWFFSFSGLSVLFLGFSLLSVLFLDTSYTSVLLRGCSNWSVLCLELYLWEGDFSTVVMNFLRCLINSG